RLISVSHTHNGDDSRGRIVGPPHIQARTRGEGQARLSLSCADFLAQCCRDYFGPSAPAAVTSHCGREFGPTKPIFTFANFCCSCAGIDRGVGQTNTLVPCSRSSSIQQFSSMEFRARSVVLEITKLAMP